MRIGHGYDVHPFQTGGQLVLGGVLIDFERSMKAHSDGDVVIHAICDALLGASGGRDIGHHFPDTDLQFKNIDSRQLLRNVKEFINERNFSLSNLDVTVIAQVPKLAPHIEKMCSLISNDLGVQRSQINIKATTTEQLGYIGREEGIAVHAVCLLLEP